MKKAEIVRKNKTLQFIGEDPARALQDIADVLNQGRHFDQRLSSTAHAKLLRLVRAWKDSGPDLSKMKVREDDRSTLQEDWKAFETDIAPMGHGGAYICLSPTGPNFRDLVAVYFIRLILCPLRLRLGGPCPNCDKWFVRKTERPSIYCCRTCAGNSVKSRARNQMHDQKLERARLAIKNYKSSVAYRRKFDWKDYVSQAESIDKKWLTRSVHNGELVPPKKG